MTRTLSIFSLITLTCSLHLAAMDLTLDQMLAERITINEALTRELAADSQNAEEMAMELRVGKAWEDFAKLVRASPDKAVQFAWLESELAYEVSNAQWEVEESSGLELVAAKAKKIGFEKQLTHLRKLKAEHPQEPMDSLMVARLNELLLDPNGLGVQREVQEDEELTTSWFAIGLTVWASSDAALKPAWLRLEYEQALADMHYLDEEELSEDEKKKMAQQKASYLEALKSLDAK
jgi:hypothetical protein